MPTKRKGLIPDDQNSSELKPETNSDQFAASTNSENSLPVVHWSEVDPNYLTFAPETRHLKSSPFQLLVHCALKGKNHRHNYMVVFDREFATFRLSSFLMGRFPTCTGHEINSLLIDVMSKLQSVT